MEEFKSDVQKWIALDNHILKLGNKIKEIQEQSKSYKENKEILTNRITNFMRENKIEENIITTSDGSIKFHETVSHGSITLKFLKTALLQYFNNDEETATKVFDFIKNNRSSKTSFDLFRKIN